MMIGKLEKISNVHVIITLPLSAQIVTKVISHRCTNTHEIMILTVYLTQKSVTRFFIGQFKHHVKNSY